MPQIRPWLRLVRLPNTLTAAADVLAGAAVAGAGLGSARVVIAACGSALIYAGAIALNDWVDRAVDRDTHPDRPLPTGAVQPRAALVLSIALLAAGTASGLAFGLAHFGITAGLALAAVAYDLVSSRAVGPVLMGTCRGLNVLRGLTLGSAGMGLMALVGLAALWLGLLITAVSLRERKPTPVIAVRLPGTFLLVPLLAPAAAALLLDAPKLALAGAAAGGMLLFCWVVRPVLATPPDPARTVFRGVFGLIPFNALYGLAAGSPLAALVILALLPVSRLAARLVGQRGS